MENIVNQSGAGNREEQKFENLAEFKNRSKSSKDIAAFVVGLRNANIPESDIPNALTSMGISMEEARAFLDDEKLVSVSQQKTPPPQPEVRMENPNPKPQAKAEPVRDPQKAAYEKAVAVSQQPNQQKRRETNEEGVGSIFKVPTVDVDLPSGGLFYNGKSSVSIKYLTASEDDILFSPELIQKNKAIDALLDAVVQDKDLRPSQMLTGDRNYLVMFVRRTGFGDIYEPGAMACRSCGHIHSPKIDLSQLKMKELMYRPDEKGWYSVNMPTMKGVSIKFRFLTGEDEDYLAKKLTSSAKKYGNVRVPAILTEKYLLQIMEVNGQTDKIFIKSFIDAMPMMDSHFFREYVAQIEPGIDLQYSFECPSCGFTEDRDVPIGPKLFYPNADL
jgi:hypothetical protein